MNGYEACRMVGNTKENCLMVLLGCQSVTCVYMSGAALSPGNKVLSGKPSYNPSKIVSVCRLRLPGTSGAFSYSHSQCSSY